MPPQPPLEVLQIAGGEGSWGLIGVGVAEGICDFWGLLCTRPLQSQLMQEAEIMGEWVTGEGACLGQAKAAAHM